MRILNLVFIVFTLSACSYYPFNHLKRSPSGKLFELKAPSEERRNLKLNKTYIKKALANIETNGHDTIIEDEQDEYEHANKAMYVNMLKEEAKLKHKSKRGLNKLVSRQDKDIYPDLTKTKRDNQSQELNEKNLKLQFQELRNLIEEAKQELKNINTQIDDKKELPYKEKIKKENMLEYSDNYKKPAKNLISTTTENVSNKFSEAPLIDINDEIYE